MLKKVDSKRRLGIVLVVLAVLVVGITSSSYADPPSEQLSGPAVVGTLGVAESTPGFTVTFNNTKCRGKDVPPAPTGAVVTLPDGIATLADITAPRLLEGLRIQLVGPVSSECPLQNLIVKAVMPSKFINNVTTITADVVLLFVVTP